ncbi:MAG: TRL domain-containing protein [Desulfobacterales bacterium]
MRFRFAVLVIGLVILLFQGCAYVNIRTPYDTDLNRTELGSKTGTAEAYSVLWLVAWGDASYSAAARNGQITVMNHADQEVVQVLFGLYTRWRIVVYGD